MSQWARANPEIMAEIASLPLGAQNDALRDAIGYDPDRIREEYEEGYRGVIRPSEDDLELDDD